MSVFYMNKKHLLFFGIFSLVLMVVIVSALNYNFEVTLDRAILEQSLLVDDREFVVRADLVQAGFDLYETRYTKQGLKEVVRYMSDHDDQYASDWHRLWREVNCFERWWNHERQPGEIFEMQGDRIYSYCLPSGILPYAINLEEEVSI